MTNTTTVLSAIVVSASLAFLILCTSASSGQTSSPSADFPAGEQRIETADSLTGDPGRGAPPPSAVPAPLPPAVPAPHRPAVPAPLPPAVPAPLPPAVPAPLPPAVPAPLPPAVPAPIRPAVPAPPSPEATTPATACLHCCRRKTRINKHGPNAWAKATGGTAIVILGLLLLYSLVVLGLVVTNRFNGYKLGLKEKLENVQGGAIEHIFHCIKLVIVGLLALLLSVKLGWVICQSLGWTENASPDLEEIQQILEAAEEVL